MIEHHILNGVILSGIGSLDGCTFFDPQEIPGKPGCYGYVTAHQSANAHSNW